jgi:hypothetical protein
MPVSGPGALSKRSDLPAPGGLPYGEGQALAAQQSAAPMGQTPALPTPSITGLDAPTANPSQPITAGAALGQGPGPEALTTTSTAGQPAGGPISSLLARAAASDPSGELAQLLVVAQQKGL